MTKISFFYFVLLVLPILFLIRLRIDGMQRARVAMVAFACISFPFALYLAIAGRGALAWVFGASFGWGANLFYVPLVQFLAEVIREQPGLVFSFLLTVSALIYLAIKRRILWGPDLFALLITIGFGMIVLASHNREIRFAFPVMVALPFLTAVLLSGHGNSVPSRLAVLAAGLAFFILLAAAVPTGYRADRKSLITADAVLSQATGCDAKRIVLATDSPTLNGALMKLAIEVSESWASVEVESLAWHAAAGVPVEHDFHVIDEADQVVFQDNEKLYPPFTIQRVTEYQRHVRQGGYLPVRITDDVSVYPIRCRR
jgi:hypothetical protein